MTSHKSKPVPVPLPPSHTCFVCGRDNDNGLALRFKAVGDRVQTTCTVAEHFAGFEQRTHGGIVAALLDEAMGWATVLVSQRFTYTVELTVRYKDQVPVGVPLEVAGWVERDARRLLFAAAEIRDGDERLLANATAKFMKVSAEETATIAGSLIYSPGAWKFAADQHQG